MTTNIKFKLRDEIFIFMSLFQKLIHDPSYMNEFLFDIDL